jgi:hypothetical protein
LFFFEKFYSIFYYQIKYFIMLLYKSIFKMEQVKIFLVNFCTFRMGALFFWTAQGSNNGQ